MSHFYAITRTDLPVQQQAIQSAHAQFEFARQIPEILLADHPPFVWLEVGSQMELLLIAAMLKSAEVKVVQFHDPDYLGYNPSAIACVLPEEKRYLLAGLPLWKCQPAKVKKNGVLGWLLRQGKKN